jgi:hypothetical protein
MARPSSAAGMRARRRSRFGGRRKYLSVREFRWKPFAVPIAAILNCTWPIFEALSKAHRPLRRDPTVSGERKQTAFAVRQAKLRAHLLRPAHSGVCDSRIRDDEIAHRNLSFSATQAEILRSRRGNHPYEIRASCHSRPDHRSHL